MASRSHSPSEGEIIETSSSEEKATKSQSGFRNNVVDRPSRKYRRDSVSRSRSPYRSPKPKASPRYSSRSRSRSPYRAASGSKRPLSNDHYGREDGSHRDRDRDPRNFRVHYEDNRSSNDEHSSRSLHRKDRNRDVAYYARNEDHKGKRQRRESPPNRGENRREISSRKDDATKGANAKHDSTYLKPERARNGRHDEHKSTKAGAMASQLKANGAPPSESQSEASAEPEPEPVDEAALIEQRRKRREAIKAKHSAQPSPMLVQALSLQHQSSATASQSTTPAMGVESEGVSQPASPRETPQSTPREGSPAIIVTKDSDLAKPAASADQEDGPSAADYDPTVDMQEDKVRAEHHNHEEDVSAAAYDETQPTKQDMLIPDPPPPELSAAADAELDMFAEVEDDMFAEAPTRARPDQSKTHPQPMSKSKALDMSMLDDFDDPEGYYKINLGELLDNRYQVQLNLGRGMFSAVVRALDSTTQSPVAIKIIRRNETMRKAALKEIDILTLINASDPDDKKHLIRLQRHFEHKGHICMVFESLSINLREVLKKFGRDVGINLQAVRAYAHQLFLSLSLLRKCNILHADLKPDNILVNESRSLLKLCDLGSASDASATEDQPTPYLVSRFYRAPELILGLSATFAVDMWSAGCTLFELYSGKILFAGRSNNQMLKAIMDCRGRFPQKSLLRKAPLAYLHFDEQGNFRSVERDKAGGRDVVRVVNVVKPVRDLRQRVQAAGSGTEEQAELAMFVDLLDKCLAVNPDRRCSPLDALRHPFINRAK